MTRRIRLPLALGATLACLAIATAIGRASPTFVHHQPSPLPSPRPVCISSCGSIVDLGSIVGSVAADFVPTAINNADQIVGFDGGTSANGNAGAAFLINPDRSFVTFGRSGIDGTLYVPTAISNSGKRIVGDAVDTSDDDGIATWTVNSPRSVSQNYAVLSLSSDVPIVVSNAGEPVAGVYFYGFNPFSITNFPSQGCAITDFSARAINDFGTIVGSGGGYAAYGSTTACAKPIAFEQPANGSTQAHGINAVGDLLISLTGPAAPAFGAEYLVRNGKSFRVGLPAAYSSNATYLVARGINDGDEIVGDVLSQTPPFASVAPFVYRNGTSTDLNALLPSRSGWKLLTAVGVSAGGEIVGTGYHAGVLRGYAFQP